MKIFTKVSMAILVVAFIFGLVGPIAAFAATSPSLGQAGSYGVLGGTFINTSVTTVNGDVGFTTQPAVAPLPAPRPSGTYPNYGDTANDTPQARIDAGLALTDLNSTIINPCTENLGVIVNLSTVGTHPTGVYTPGVYCSTGAMSIGTAGITLNGAGTYIFRSVGALTSADGSVVTLANGASSCDVFWAPTAATTLGANTTFVGTIIDNANAITVGNLTSWIGRALSLGAGVVTTDTNTINTTCSIAALTSTGGSGFTNVVLEAPQLTVIKHVINDNGGTATASDFNIHVKIYGRDVSGSPAPGQETGRIYQLTETGTSTVSEVAAAGYSASFSGDCNSSGQVALEYGDKKTCTITNNDIEIFPPLINVTKIPTPLALPAGPGLVTYDYTVTNLGTVAMSNITVVDNKCSSVSFVSGDTDGDSKLDVSEAWKYRCSATLSQTTANSVIASGQANGFTAVDSATATVVVGASLTPPLIHVVKKPNVFVLHAGGGPVTYSYTVTNPGTAPLNNVSISDDKCTGLPGRVVGHAGDINKNDLLENNETWSFTCQTNVNQTTTNVGTAIGYANGLSAVDLSSAMVVVSAPTLPKTGYEEDAAVKTIKRSLFKGNRSSDVAILQKFLVAQNKGPAAQALAKAYPTTYFGALTRAALAEFQAAVGITPAVGNFGSKTRAYISENY